MKIAAALCDFHIGEKELDLLVGVYELVMERGGSATLEDVVGVVAFFPLGKLAENFGKKFIHLYREILPFPDKLPRE